MILTEYVDTRIRFGWSKKDDKKIKNYFNRHVRRDNKKIIDNYNNEKKGDEI
jgi:hypothetical protein